MLTASKPKLSVTCTSSSRLLGKRKGCLASGLSRPCRNQLGLWALTIFNMSKAKTRTFEEASAQIQANLQKHLARQKSKNGALDDDSEKDSDEEADVQIPQEVLEKVFEAYNFDSNDKKDNQRTRQAILDSFRSGLSSCLICISSLKKNDPIWSCTSCFCSFHLTCIQRWGKDCVFQQQNDLDNGHGGAEAKALLWACPNCRHPFQRSDIPTKYFCYCGKEQDPTFDPWIVPHSCGESCRRQLQPECGHQCLILCHPGPCPPCPQTVTSPCFCGNSAPATKRCAAKHWSCGKRCGQTLNCGQHPCLKPCHPGPCPPCEKTSVQLCQCQRQQKMCQCASPVWQCQEKCKRPLKCGHHVCDLVCHSGSCPPCPLSELRHCPCGKSSYQLDCTLATPTCGDTCGKTLSCGSHQCAERCHRGDCGSCLQRAVKTCRCGSKRKEMACTKPFTCDVKCKRLRDCNKHPCSRKCCDGDCPPCETSCNKSLSCKNHKCASRCHQGSCYPCNQTKEVTCNCGKSRILVPCGREKATKPPKCKQICQKPADCHHDERKPHPCHFGDCPPCKQICNFELDCGHICPATCHDRVKVVKGGVKAAVPWEEVSPKVEVKAVNCPKCEYPVPVTCLGGHDTSDWPCHLAKVGSCGRICGRRLKCGNHVCQRDCHRVKNATNVEDAGSNCRPCELECQRARPEGCTHPCTRPCHRDDCQACSQMVRILCHCGLTQPYVECGQWLSAEGEEKVKLASCLNQCPKILECGHRCSKICHPDDCSSSEECKKRVKLFCPCKSRKEERPCNKRKTGPRVMCDDKCKANKAKDTEQEDQSEETWRQEEEDRLKREELERFERQMEGGKKRRRQRQRHSEVVEVGFMEKWKTVLIICSVFVAIIAIYAAFIHS